jgi:hypothetical protein
MRRTKHMTSWYLSCWLNDSLVLGENSDDFQSPRQIELVSSFWQCCPAQSQRTGKGSLMSGTVGVKRKIFQHLAFDPQLIA